MVASGQARHRRPQPMRGKRMKVGGKTYSVTLTRDEYLALSQRQHVQPRQSYDVAGLITGQDAGDNSEHVEQLRQELRTNMGYLSSQERDALLLHFDGLSYRAIAAKLGLSKSHVHRM